MLDEFANFLVAIVVVRNDPEGLHSTLLSIRDQNVSMRVIVVDGASTDETPQVAHQFATELNLLLVSEVDQGPYDAMNKGLSLLSDREIVWFVNAGDCLSSDSVVAYLRTQIDPQTFSWGYGPIRVCESDGSVRQISNVRDFTMRRLAYDIPMVCHQSVLARADLIREVGGFDTSLLIAADLKVELRLAQKWEPKIWDRPIVDYRAGGISDRHLLYNIFEQGHVRRAELNLHPLERLGDHLYDVYRILRLGLGKIKRLAFAHLGAGISVKHDGSIPIRSPSQVHKLWAK